MKKYIVGVALAALLAVTAGYAADDFIPRKNNSSAQWGTTSTFDARVQRMTDDNKAMVEATPDTTTAAAFASMDASLQQIDWRLNTGTGHMGRIEGIGNTTLAELQAQSLQLGVLEGAGTTLNVTATAILAEAVTIKTNTSAIETAIEAIGISSQNIQGATPDGGANTANPVAVGLVDGSGNVQTFLGDTSGRITIGDISGGTQTNDIKITLDGETLTIADASENTIGARAVLDGTEWFFVADWAAAQTDTVVKACPAGKRIVWTYAFITSNNTNNFQFQDEDDTDVSPTIYLNGIGSGAVEPGAKDMPLWILDTDKDLEIDTTQAVAHGIRATGYIID